MLGIELKVILVVEFEICMDYNNKVIHMRCYQFK